MTREQLLSVAKPILFNTEMVRAILDGRKTVTRRVVKPQPPMDDKHRPHHAKLRRGFDGEKPTIHFEFLMENYAGCAADVITPRYDIGDILYVRETAMIQSMKNFDRTVKLYFKADNNLEQFSISSEFYNKLLCYPQNKWLSPYYLTKEAARIFLCVTDVRVERLRDITDEGAKSEGANIGVGLSEKMQRSAIERFATLWNSAIKPADAEKYGWEANPFVWVYEFERIDI